MDFKSLINKIDSIDIPVETPKAPELPKAIKLNENAELRVLAGTSSYIAEAKKKVEEGAVKSAMMADAEKMSKAEFIKKYGEENAETWDNMNESVEEGLDMNLLKAAQGSMSKNPKDAESDKNVKKKYGYRMDGEPAERDDDPTKQERRGRKRKNEDVEIDAEKFKAKFTKMIEAKKEKMSRKDKKMDEAKKPDDDNDGVPNWADKKPGKDDNADKKGEKKETKGLSAKQKKLPPGLQKAIAKKKGKTESVRASKKVVAESVEQKLSLKDMLRIVKESGGQQAIDPMDKTLWSWANRVASSKVQESQKAEIFAAMIYERNGGRFEMYDVLSEDQK
jgi:hypothetical protein